MENKEPQLEQMTEEEQRTFQKGRQRMEAYADELMPILIDAIRQCVPWCPFWPLDPVAHRHVQKRTSKDFLSIKRSLHAAAYMLALLPLFVHANNPPQNDQHQRVQGA